MEQCEIERMGNLEKKVYRATALKYLPQQLLDFEPKSKPLREACKTYAEIQKQSMKDTAVSNEIPLQLAEIDPVDYGVYLDLKGFYRIMLDPRTIARMQRLEKQLAECKEFENLSQTVTQVRI